MDQDYYHYRRMYEKEARQLNWLYLIPLVLYGLGNLIGYFGREKLLGVYDFESILGCVLAYIFAMFPIWGTIAFLIALPFTRYIISKKRLELARSWHISGDDRYVKREKKAAIISGTIATTSAIAAGKALDKKFKEFTKIKEHV